jgi:hypothetical protein
VFLAAASQRTRHIRLSHGISAIQPGGKNTHADICASLKLFASKVMSEFHAEEPERQRRKMAELPPYIEAAFKPKKYLTPLADEDVPEYPAYGLAVAEESARAPVADRS